MENSYKFFQNKQCEFFPCHKVSDDKLKDFSCLMCYCPLNPYEDCGGNYAILPNGWKDCTNCTIPHFNYLYVLNKLMAKNGGK